MTHTTIVVISDTHGNIEPACDFIKKMAPDVVVHLGDYAKDANKIAAKIYPIPLYNVKGNCDGYSPEREELLFVMRGHTVFAAHGHKQKVKQDLYGIYFAALDNEADIALFGHTHIPYINTKDGILLLNPGTAGSGTKLTAAVIRLNEEEYDAEIVEI